MAIILDGTTGLNTPGVTDTGNLSVSGTSTLTGGITGAAVDLTSNVTGTLPIANGGTSLTTLTANNVILGNGTSAPLFVAPSTSGNALISNGTTWASQSIPVPSGSQIYTALNFGGF